MSRSAEPHLKYMAQPGALNEAFSDIMATTMEWEFNEPTSVELPPRDRADRMPRLVGWRGRGSRWTRRSASATSRTQRPPISRAIGRTGTRVLRQQGRAHQQHDPNARVLPDGQRRPQRRVVQARLTLRRTATSSCRPSRWRKRRRSCSRRGPCSLSFSPAESISARRTTRLLRRAELLFPGSDLHRAAIELAWTAVGRGQ